MAGNPDPLAVIAMAGHAQAFAEINFFAGFNPFGGGWVWAVHILNILQDICRDAGLINIFVKSERFWQKADGDCNQCEENFNGRFVHAQ